jgi:HK97 family phage prohead protease
MAIMLHKEGHEHARALAEHGKVDHGPFSFDNADRDALLGPKGTHVAELGKHHLGVDDAADEGDARRFRYPVAKDGKVFSRACRSCMRSAEKNGHEEVRAAAESLMGEMGVSPGPDDAGGEYALPPEHEVRCLMAGLELRAAAAGASGPGTLIGYAAVFNMLSEDLGGFREKILPGAFGDCIKRCDVRALRNHDPSQLLGRNRAGTLRMREDALGLRVEIDLSDTQVGRDTAEDVRSRNMDGQSFSFRVKPDDVEWIWESDPPTRIVRRFEEIYDVGPVTYPAYTDTSAAMRSMDKAKPAPERPPAQPPAASVERVRASHSRAKAELQIAAARIRGL